MNDKQKPIDSLPEEFETVEAAAEFWDTHDTTDYTDEFETVEAEIQFQRRFEVEIDADLMPALTKQAHQRGVAVKNVVSDLLREKLRPAVETQ